MLREHLMRYLVGGAFVFMVSIGLLYLFVDILGIWYLWGTTAAFILSIGVSFTVQKFWTFRDHSADGLMSQVGIYAFLQIFNLVANDGFMFIAVSVMGFSHLLAQIGTTIIISAWSFVTYQYLFVRNIQCHDE